MSVGLPGSGKSAYLRNFCAFQPHTVINPDSIRQELTGRMEDMSRDAQVWRLAYERLKKALASTDLETDLIALDATFLQLWARNEAYRVIEESGVEYKLTIIETTLDIEQSLERMSSRMRQVFREVLERMSAKRASISDEEKSRHKNFEHILIDIDTPLFYTGYTAFIGDIHSCYDELRRLLESIGYWQENDIWLAPKDFCKLIFLGDLTDRGPESVKVLKTVMQLCKDGFAEVVIGNHDDKLYRYLKGNNVRLSHGLELTAKHLHVLTEEQIAEVKEFLGALPSSIEVDIEGKKYVAAHAYWQEWMKKPDLNPKRVRELNMYGVVDNNAAPGAPSRVSWWEDPKYQSREATVVFGHYANKVDLPHAKCADLGVCFGGEMGAFITNGSDERWVTVKSHFDWNKQVEGVAYKVDHALTYKELFDRLGTDEKGIIYDIENDPLLNKRRYQITDENGTYELTIANAAKNLFQPEARSYAQQLAKGIVYDKGAGKIVAVTLPKIYNYGEKEAANLALQSLLKEGKYQFEFVEKMDGTQVFRFVYRNKVFWATRSVIISEPNPDIDSDFMSLTMDAVKNNPVSETLLDPERYADDTLIFELMHPDNIAICHYEGKPELVLLGATQKTTNGTWLRQVSPYVEDYSFRKPARYSVSGTLDDAAKLVQELDSQNLLSEGFVANVLENNKVIFRSKFKTPRFFEAMRLMTHCTYDRVVEVCTAHNLNTLEEFKNFLMQDKDLFPEELLQKYLDFYTEYEEYQNTAHQYTLEIIKHFNEHILPMKQSGASRKEMALVIVQQPFKGHLFSLLDEKAPDIHKELKYELEAAKEKLKEAVEANAAKCS